MRHFLAAVHILLIIAYAPAIYGAPSQVLRPAYKEGELIVRFKNPLKAAKSATAQKSSILRKFKRFPAHHIKLPAGSSVQESLEAFRSDPNVLYAEPNYFARKSVVPNDPSYVGQWNLPLISAPSAWDNSVGSRGTDAVIVAVLDTGIAYSHPDLAPNIWVNSGEFCGDGIDNDGNGITDDCYGANFGGFSRGDPWDDDTADSHGTHVAGIMGAVGNNGVGIAGVNWAAKIMAVKFLHGPEGVGELADALSGVEYSLNKGAKLINMSFEVDEDSVSLRDAVAAAENAGVLVVSAAGNTGKNLDQTGVYPASIRSPVNITVAASTSVDTLPSYSDYGRHTVELAAPGGVATGSADAVLSTVWLNGGATLYRTTAGTSMAAPHVTGAAALIWNLHPLLSAAQVKARILNGVDPVPAFAENTITGGRLNLEKALNSQNLPAVFDVSPFQLSWNGGTIVVKGVGFGISPGTISLAGVNLNANSWSDSEITAVVPQNSKGGIVQVNGQGGGFPVTVTPLINLAATAVSGAAPLTVEIVAEILSGVTITKYEWDLGDGIFREIQGVTSRVTHVFSAAGNYKVSLKITDNNGNTGIESLTITITPPSSGSGSGCFIATAAYGSYLHPKVQLLRNFRDSHLITNPPGRVFVGLYYRLSPPVAHLIAKHEALRIIFRWTITPLVLLILYPLLTMVMILVVAVIAGVPYLCRIKKTKGSTLIWK